MAQMKLDHFVKYIKSYQNIKLLSVFSVNVFSVKPLQETVPLSTIVYFVRSKIQKLSAQSLILDTSVPQAYVTQQQHPHSTIFRLYELKKIHRESSEGKQGPCSAHAVQLPGDIMCLTRCWEQDVGVKGQLSQETGGSSVCVHILQLILFQQQCTVCRQHSYQ